MAMFGGMMGRSQGGRGGWNVGKPSPDRIQRKRDAMADVLDGGDFGRPAQYKASPPAARPDLNSPNNLVSSGQSVFQAMPTTTMSPAPMGRDMDKALKRAQFQQAQESGARLPDVGPRVQGGGFPREGAIPPDRSTMPVPQGGSPNKRVMRRFNPMSMGLRGPTTPTGAVPAGLGSIMGYRR